MTRPTRRGWALLGVAVLTYLAARVLGTWELYLVALAFAGMTVVAWVLVAAGSRRLTVSRRVTPERPLAGDPLRFRFVLGSRWRLPGLHVVLRDAAGGAEGLPREVVVEDMGLRRERAATTPSRPARRGVHLLPAFTATVEDPMGLARARRQAGEPLRLFVAPRLEELASCAPCARSGAQRGGGKRRLPTRNAWEFRGIRPHTPGEPVERVDWKSTAKTGALMLREMEADTEDDLTVLLDAPGARRDERDEVFETAVVVAGSVAAFTLRSGHTVSLLLPDDGWRDLRLTPDAASRRRLLAALAATRRPEPGRPRASLPVVLGGRARARRDLLALVTTRVDPELVAAIGRLRREGVSVSVAHVLPERPRGAGRPEAHHAGPGAALSGDDGPAAAAAAAVTAAGGRYFPVAGAGDVRTAFAARTDERLARVR